MISMRSLLVAATWYMHRYRVLDTLSLFRRKLVAQVFENFNHGVDAVRGIFADPSSLSFNLPRFSF
jgi:hypothetical protein